MGEPSAADQAKGSERWCVDSLSPAERAQLARAFSRARGLREELEDRVLAGLPKPVREQFAIALANRLAEAARPQAAVMPALVDTARALGPIDGAPPPSTRESEHADWLRLNLQRLRRGDE